MKIHTNTLTAQDVHEATRAAGMRGVYADVATKGSRSRVRSLDVKLSGTSNRWQNPGTGPRNVDHAATWDEWGMVINALFERDPEALIGPYRDKDHFHEVTVYRFESLTAPYAHGDHKWEFVGPRHFACDCGADRINS